MKKVDSISSIIFCLFIIMTIFITSCGGGGDGGGGGGGETSASWKGMKMLGTTSDDSGSGVAVDARGNVDVTGQTLGGLDGNTSAGGGDMFLVK